MIVYDFSKKLTPFPENLDAGKMPAVLRLMMQHKKGSANVEDDKDDGSYIAQYDDIKESEAAKRCTFSLDRWTTARNVARTIVSCYTAALVGSRTNEGTQIWNDLGWKSPEKVTSFKEISVQGRRLNGDVDAPKNQSDIRRDFGVPLPKATMRLADIYRKSGKQRKVEFVVGDDGKEHKIAFVHPDVLDTAYWSKKINMEDLPTYGVMTYIHEYLKQYPETLGFKFLGSDEFGYPIWEEETHDGDCDLTVAINPCACRLSFTLTNDQIQENLKKLELPRFDMRAEKITHWDGLDLIISVKKVLFGKKNVLEDDEAKRLRTVIAKIVRLANNPGDDDAIWAAFSNLELRRVQKFINTIPTLAESIELEQAINIFGDYWKQTAELKAELDQLKEVTNREKKAALQKAINAKIASRAKVQSKEDEQIDHRQWAVENTSDEDFADIE